MADAYQVERASPAKRDLARLPEKAATAVIEFIYAGLADNPRRVGRELHLASCCLGRSKESKNVASRYHSARFAH